MLTKLVLLIAILTCVTIPAQAERVRTQLDCLSKVIYHEAKGEPLEGKQAVGFVVLNRTNHNDWPKDVCSVTLQPRQFSSFTLDIPIQRQSEEWKTSQKTARKVFYRQVRDPTNGALFFFSPKKVKPTWQKHLTFIKDIGNHRFLTLKERNNERSKTRYR